MSARQDLTVISQQAGMKLSLCLLLVGTLTEATPANRILTVQDPWVNPCGGEVPSNDIPSDMFTLTPFRQPILDNRPQFMRDIKNLIRTSEDVNNRLIQYSILNHFGHNASHLTELSSHPFIESLNGRLAQMEEDSMPLVYENLVRAAILIEEMREDLAADRLRTQHELKVSEMLDVYARAGTIDDLQVEAGIYQILCRIYRFLTFNDHATIDTAHLSREIIPQGLRDPQNKAERHNRDYIFLQTLRELLGDSRASLRQMRRLARAPENAETTE